MLSYMLPVDEKPPPGPTAAAKQIQLALSGPGGPGGGGPHQHLQHVQQQQPLANQNQSISKETSVSSFLSDEVSHSSSMTSTSFGEKPKTKVVVNGAKPPPLKRVSFGSSKGSMVETLIFESPVQEEPEPSPVPEGVNPFPEDQDQTEAERERVRVTFFQQTIPQEVDLPDEPAILFDDEFTPMMAAAATTVGIAESNHVVYNRTESVESGWENPFRPGGDLSREADEIVQLIKGGKPITPTSTTNPECALGEDKNDCADRAIANGNGAGPIVDTPKKASAQPLLGSAAASKNANGNVKNEKTGAPAAASPGALDVKRATVKPDADVEHITLKKKPKCKCCVIQ